MLCINNLCTDAYFNLASEEYLFHYFSEDIFMLWQNEPSVIIGKHQNVWAEVNLDFVRKKQIKIARRFSGGGAVYHDLGNLNLTFIENNSNADFDKFSKQMLNLLTTIGVDAKSDERRALTIDGLKISGSAQCIHKKKVMYHATLLFSTDLKVLYSALHSDPGQLKDKDAVQRPASVKSVESPVTNISDHLSKPFPINDFKKRIMNYFLTNLTENQAYTFKEDDLIMINHLSEEKYATSDWNLKGSLLK